MQHTVLIVDDQPHNLAAMQQALEGEHRLLFARNGFEALEAARRMQPSIVLLDIQMPDMDGYATCRALHADPRTEAIPVIFVTSLSETGNESAGFDAGAVDYIVKPISPAIVRARVNTHLSLVRASKLEASYRDAIGMLGAAGHYNDSDTGVHIWRMAAYAKALARASGCDAERATQIELAAPMHDTGKLGIPDSILCKPGKLTESEWVIMKTHTSIGHSILSRSQAPIFRLAAEIALSHHERWDGTGYPQGLAGESIPESARIVAIADVFDALTMRRPYKEPWPIERVIDTIRTSAGNHFEPRLVEVFLGIVPDVLAIMDTWNAIETEGSDTLAAART